METPAPAIKPPTPKQQSWGAIIAMLIIILMIVVGAFYAWGKRVAKERGLLPAPAATSSAL